MDEVWKDIPEYEGYYQVSNKGRIKSLGRIVPTKAGWSKFKEERILAPNPNRSNYFAISLWRNNLPKRFEIHRLVAKTFLPDFDSKLDVHHIDGDSTNNHLDNLMMISCAEHIPLHIAGEKSPNATLTDDEVFRIKWMIMNSNKLNVEIAKEFGVSPTTICSIANGRSWLHVIP